MNLIEERPAHDSGISPHSRGASPEPENVSTKSTNDGTRAVATSYLSRRLPWGTPWWPYAVVLGAANLVRQLIQPDVISTSMELTIFVLMVGAVIGVVTFVHKVLWRHLRPTPAEFHQIDEPPHTEKEQLGKVLAVKPQRTIASTGAVAEQRVRQEKPKTKWAPWWWYVIPILGVNYVRQGLVPVGVVPEWAVVLIVLAISAVLFIAITYAYRISRR